MVWFYRYQFQIKLESIELSIQDGISTFFQIFIMPMHSKFPSVMANFFAFSLILSFFTAPAYAAGSLPAAVDGQAIPSLAPMLERVTPAVVNVNSKTTVKVRNPLMDDPFFRQFFDLPNAPQQRIQQSRGSGVVIDAARGLVLTNNHVIAGADDISVTLADGRTLKASRVGADPDTDVAVIRVAPQNLKSIPIADSAKLRVGDFVVAVGNPFGLGQTVTSGIVSALGRSGLQGVGYQNFIQTDASINPGNSGGALVNLRGELIGINTAIFTPSGGNVGIGFAIPTNLAKDVMRQLLAFGEVKRGSLGLQAQDIDADIARALGREVDSGALITRVTPGAPAQISGLKVGDVITAIDNKPIRSARDVYNLEGLLPLNARVVIQLVRERKPISLIATLKPAVIRSVTGAQLDSRLNGLVLTDLDEKSLQNGASGVLLKSVLANSVLAKKGLRAGDLIIGANRIEIESLSELETITRSKPRQLTLTIARAGRAYYLTL